MPLKGGRRRLDHRVRLVRLVKPELRQNLSVEHEMRRNTMIAASAHDNPCLFSRVPKDVIENRQSLTPSLKVSGFWRCILPTLLSFRGEIDFFLSVRTG